MGRSSESGRGKHSAGNGTAGSECSGSDVDTPSGAARRSVSTEAASRNARVADIHAHSYQRGCEVEICGRAAAPDSGPGATTTTSSSTGTSGTKRIAAELHASSRFDHEGAWRCRWFGHE